MAKFFKTPQTLAYMEGQLKVRHRFFTVRALKSMHVSEDTRRGV